MKRALLTIPASILALGSVAACGVVAPAGPQAGETRMCGSQERVIIDCSSEVSYQGASGKAGLSVMNVAELKGEFEQKAIREVNQQVELFVAAQTRACREYNACVMSSQEYRAEAKATREKLQVIPALVKALGSAKTEGERSRVLDKLYRGVVPAEKRSDEVSLRIGMVASLPDDLGGHTYSVADGDAVPTGARVVFQVDVSQQAYVYIFQTTPRGEVNVLFPDPRIGTKNPLAPNFTSRIPNRKAFRVNDKDIGTEKVYVVASRKPVEDLDAALGKVKAGEVKTAKDHGLIAKIVRVAPPGPRSAKCKTRALELDDSGPKGGCRRSRALVLSDDADDGSAGPPPMRGGVKPALAVRNEPGDDRIVTVFHFEHMKAAAFKKSQTATKASKSRGIVIED